MGAKCDQSILTILSAGLSVLSIMSYMDNLSLREQLDKCQSRLLHCKEMQFITMKNVFQEFLSFKPFLPKEKKLEVLKLEHYVTSIMPALSKEVNRDEGIPAYSCPEKYKLMGWPYLHGFTRENCSKPPIFSSTSLILVNPVANVTLFRDVIDNAFKVFYHVIVVVSQQISSIIKKIQHKTPRNRLDTIIIPSRSGYSLGDSLNNAVNLVKSPFVLIAPQISRLGTNLDVERLIHVQETTKAGVVGGAIKDTGTGKWDRGCYQSQLKLYTLKYTAGYYLSYHECLYCDNLVSPFLARTKFLREYKLKKFNNGVLQDYFLRLKHEGKKILSCPDVMFYVRRRKQTERDLDYFATQWDIRRIIQPDNSVLWFGYRARPKSKKNMDFSVLGKYKPKFTCGASASVAVSPDCRHNLLDALMFIINVFKKHDILISLEEGTLLGVVKFNHILPWERDADLTFMSRQYPKITKLVSVFKKRGFLLKLDTEPTYENGFAKGGVVYVKAYGWHIELFGTAYEMPRTEPYTLVNLGNHWVYGPENPGLFSRNRYGVEIYRHAEHWRANNKKSGFADYEPKKFPECSKPTHHSCLDQFHADGDIPFLDYL